MKFNNIINSILREEEKTEGPYYIQIKGEVYAKGDDIPVCPFSGRPNVYLYEISRYYPPQPFIPSIEPQYDILIGRTRTDNRVKNFDHYLVTQTSNVKDGIPELIYYDNYYDNYNYDNYKYEPTYKYKTALHACIISQDLLTKRAYKDHDLGDMIDF